jgi:hypothetical protein
MEWFLLWFGLAIVVGVAANTRGRNAAGWIFLAIVISPLLAGLLVLALPNLKNDPSHTYGEPTKVCPYCAERILAAAVVCRHCKSDLGQVQLPTEGDVVHPAAQLQASGSMQSVASGFGYVAIILAVVLGLSWVMNKAFEPGSDQPKLISVSVQDQQPSSKTDSVSPKVPLPRQRPPELK